MGGRGKVILQRITNENKRKACQKKRMAGLFKKAHELSTLCDVESATIVYCPGDMEPSVWPPSYEMVKETVDKFLGRPEVERSKYAVTHLSFLAEKVKKKRAKFSQIKKKNDDMEFQILLASLTDQETSYCELDSTQSNAVVTFGDGMKEKLKQKIEAKQQQTAPPTVGQMRKRKGKDVDSPGGDIWFPPSAHHYQPQHAAGPAGFQFFPPVAGFSPQTGSQPATHVQLTYGSSSAAHFSSPTGFH